MSEHDYPPNEGQKMEDEQKAAENAANDADDDLSDAAIAEAIAKETGTEVPPFVSELRQSDIAKPAPEAAAEQGGGAKADAEEVAKLKEQMMRLAADLENTRRRSEKEKADAGRYAIANFARDLLGVADNFERALQVAGQEGEAAQNEAMSSLIAGLKMTEKELLNVLERHGVKRLDPTGQKFDPNLHQAVAQVPSDSVPSGHVVNVAQSGFTIKERVLRAAMVMVSSGPGATGGDAPTSGGHVDTKA